MNTAIAITAIIAAVVVTSIIVTAIRDTATARHKLAAEAALRRVRAACDQLYHAAVLDDGQPHTDRERGVIQAVNRIVAALNDDTSSKENSA